jgi:hypothetical protein
LITLQEYKDELIPVTMTKPERREDYYRIYMDKGITIEDAYEQYRKTFNEDKK